jgi:hypothetical protein
MTARERGRRGDVGSGEWKGMAFIFTSAAGKTPCLAELSLTLFYYHLVGGVNEKERGDGIQTTAY